MCGSETGFSEITPAKSGSIRQPHWHRHLDVKRPTRAVEELHQVAATRTERRLFAQVDFRREMRPIVFVDPAAFPSTDLVKLPTTRLLARVDGSPPRHHYTQGHPSVGHI